MAAAAARVADTAVPMALVALAVLGDVDLILDTHSTDLLDLIVADPRDLMASRPDIPLRDLTTDPPSVIMADLTMALITDTTMVPEASVAAAAGVHGDVEASSAVVVSTLASS
jgi:hypothetical protein